MAQRKKVGGEAPTSLAADLIFRKVSQIALPCYVLIVCALLFHAGDRLVVHLPHAAMWTLMGAAVVLMVPAWDYLGRCNSLVNKILCAALLVATMVQVHARAGSTQPPASAFVDQGDPQLDELLAQTCDPGAFTPESKKKCLQEIRRTTRARVRDRVEKLAEGWRERAGKQTLLLESGRTYSNKLIRPGWLTAEPLTPERIQNLKDALSELVTGDNEMVLWCDQQPDYVRKRSLELGITPHHTSILEGSCEKELCSTRRQYQVKALWHQRLLDTVLFIEKNADEIRVTPDRKSLRLANKNLEAPLRQLMSRISRTEKALQDLNTRDAATEQPAESQPETSTSPGDESDP